MNKDYKKIARSVISIEIEGLKKLQKNINNSFNKAVELILKTEGKLVFCGIGKSGLIARKAAATLSSVGTPSFYIDGNDFSHGDSGGVTKKDIMMIYSASGETNELKRVITYCNRMGIKLISISQKKNSTLSKSSDVSLIIPTSKEAGLPLLPTTSTTIFLAISDALAVALMNKKKFGLYEFKQRHQSGSIGKFLTYAEDLMIEEKSRLPLINENKKMSEAVKVMTKCKLGTLIALNSKKYLTGVCSDGDIRKHSKKNLKNIKVKDMMNKSPIVVRKNTLAVKCLEIMQNKKITKLIIGSEIKKKIRVLGIISIHHILQAGIK
ncbi:KpsF/GutQ family sugar-phosphate isomerase [Pelagibacteraceae bacterium]|nr:KpsF/GutQ family sugar-phosphate isomerase [Pelagibacteraceae bacterium]